MFLEELLIFSKSKHNHDHHDHNDHSHVGVRAHAHYHSRTSAQATNLALIATLFLFCTKMAVAIYTESVGVLSESIHSGLDLISSFVTFVVIRKAALPADTDHPFGHGKIESLSAMFESGLLFVAAGYIIYEGVARWNEVGHHVHNVELGLGVIFISMVINWLVYIQNRRVAKEEESLAIETNAFHFLTDIFSSLAVFISLALVAITGWTFWDPLVAIIIAIYIFWVAVEQMKKCVSELADTALPKEELDTIVKTIEKYKKSFLNYHDLRTRKVGALRHIDLHLEICSEQKVFEAHKLCDEIEDELMKKFKKIHINIHVEPCGNHEPSCESLCAFYKIPREQVSIQRKQVST